ncbi:hypothetical protein N752_22635 [Desulforamulus aquiferis]|nr:hypothetical protein [Desulforamulus aquiferis]RYD02814.1 hypothetical protein N752_22635 [Desulforamulus aquiferis]
MTWTYDPLETANGYLNVGKLGAICTTYITDCYGEMEDPMNQGLPTDRFKVEWWLKEQRPDLSAGKEKSLLVWKQGNNRLPVPKLINDDLAGAEVVSLSVPANFQQIKESDLGLAREWRFMTRQVLTDYFNSGWAVAGFRLRRGEPVHEYLLTYRNSLGLPPAPWQKGE